jgi:hypothetical protein
MKSEVVTFKDYPTDAKDAAARIRNKAQELNEEIGKAKRLFEVECTIQLRPGGKAIDGVVVTKMY